MEQIRKNRIIALIVISALVGFGLFLFSKPNLFKILEILKFVSGIISIDLLLYGLFVKWLWKFRPFRNVLALYPNIEGTWIGTIESNWEKNAEKLLPIPTMLTVTQNFHSVNCVMHTGEMKSRSFCECFNIDSDRQVKQLVYSYTSNPDIHLRDRSHPHDGTVVFEIIESPKKRLKGKYWTERSTNGQINLEFHSSQILDKIPDFIAPHPLTEKKENKNSLKKIGKKVTKKKKVK